MNTTTPSDTAAVFVLEGELARDSAHHDLLPLPLAFPTREAAIAYVTSQQPLWGSYTIGRVPLQATPQPARESARRSEDTRMIGSALNILPNPEHRAQLERHRAERAIYEQGTTFRDGPRHVIVGERQEGKTTIAERWLLDAPDGVDRVLVTFSLAAAGEIKHRLGLKNSDPRVISFHSLTGPGRSARPDVQYGFDETVRILEQLLRLKQPPHLLTITTAAEWQGRDA